MGITASVPPLSIHSKLAAFLESRPLRPRLVSARLLTLPVHDVEVCAGPVAASEDALGRGGGARLALVEVEGPVDDGGAGLEVARVGLLQRDGVVSEEAAIVVGVVGGVGVVVVVVVGVCCRSARLRVVAAADAEAAACSRRGRGDGGRCEQEGQGGGQGELHVGRWKNGFLCGLEIKLSW
ncbi:hypothetical protein PG996_007869 [Apiospora saccharicola]|uniref:Uncharacterized protein n=1 Tax=Apiospora saccharicola TaxID=335842 RepID=A0ABR1UX17_9PEZI